MTDPLGYAAFTTCALGTLLAMRFVTWRAWAVHAVGTCLWLAYGVSLGRVPLMLDAGLYLMLDIYGIWRWRLHG